MARNKQVSRQSLLEMFSVIQEACVEVINWLNILLPFALFAMVSAQVANVGLAPLISLASYIEVQIITAFVLLGLAALVIGYKTQTSPYGALKNLSATLILAITTRSSFACIPVAVRELTENLKIDRYAADLIMPLGTTLCRLGAVPYYVISTIFIAQVYGVTLDWQALLTIVIASIAAGLASSGATGTMTVLLISMVAIPLKLPFEAAIILFIAVDPIIDIFRTLVLVYGNCALTTLIAPRESLSATDNCQEEGHIISLQDVHSENKVLGGA